VVAFGDHTLYLAFEEKQMKMYGAGDLDKFVKDIERYSIGMDEWFHRMGAVHESKENYPPYNLIKKSNVRFRLEVALAGFKKEEVKVYSENNKLFVEGHSASDDEEVEYIHKGVATRDFTRVWTISDDVVIDEVYYYDGVLVVELQRVIPDHQKRKDWL
jgi:molecular chaperone IbpA